MPKIRLIFVVLLTFVENIMTQSPSLQKENNRLFALDLLRVLACFLVVWQHITECYYINPDNILIIDKNFASCWLTK